MTHRKTGLIDLLNGILSVFNSTGNPQVERRGKLLRKLKNTPVLLNNSQSVLNESTFCNIIILIQFSLQ